jgi:hypothetical protein
MVLKLTVAEPVLMLLLTAVSAVQPQLTVLRGAGRVCENWTAWVELL